jgi:hypothetical protein
MMRIESNHAQGVFQQLRIAMLHGLTCRLCALHYRIEAIKSRLEVSWDILLGYRMTQLITASQLAVDERQIQIAIMESATSRAVVPIPAAGTCQSHHECDECSPVVVPPVTATPVRNVIGPTLPLPASAS